MPSCAYYTHKVDFSRQNKASCDNQISFLVVAMPPYSTQAAAKHCTQTHTIPFQSVIDILNNTQS
jgi:hypothetical protein